MAYLSTPYDLVSCLPLISSLSIPALQYFPLALNKDQIFEFVYRYRKWKTTVAGGESTYSLDGVSVAASIEGQFDGGDRPFITTEKDFACLLSSWSGGPTDVDTKPLNPPREDEDMQAFTGLTMEIMVLRNDIGTGELIPPLVVSDDGLTFYPQLYVTYQLFTGVLEDSEWFIEGESIDRGGVYAGSFGGSILSAPFVMYYTDTGSIPNGTITNISSITIDPLQWYTYDPGSGGDVWDANTGTQLRDPYSIQQAG